MRKKEFGGFKLQFFGGTETVTGSKFLLSHGQEKWLIDCGLFQGLKRLRDRNWAPPPVDPKDISSVILTHAHVDHSGYIPVIIKNGFRGKILASDATIELCRILLPDAGYLQEEDAKFANKQGFSKHKPALPLYTYRDAIATFSHFHEIPDHEPITIGSNVTVETYRAGHILGSRFIRVSTVGARRTSVLFAGDIGRYDALMIRSPEAVDDIDYLILEATYGAHQHPEEDIFKRFETIINDAVQRGGKVLVPAFAVGRTQEILYIIKKLLVKRRIPADIPIFLNSPLGIDATDIYSRYEQEQPIFHEHVGPEPFNFPNLHLVQDETESKKLNTLEGPAVIIAGSGMITGGRILHHLKAYASDKKSTLVLVGFQADGTRGRDILNGAKAIKIHGLQIALRCKIEYIESLSAHGDYSDVMKWLGYFKKRPKTVFLVHGEQEALDAMKNRIEKELSWNVVIPKYLDKYDLK